MGVKRFLHVSTDRPGHDYRYSMAPIKAELLGWQRQWDFETGMQATAQWYQTELDWWKAIKEKQSYQQFEST